MWQAGPTNTLVDVKGLNIGGHKMPRPAPERA
jgi:L-aminopeptidase/D-esterase-like protein